MFSKTKILVADDNQLSRDLIVSVLTKMGVTQIVQCEDGLSAWTKLGVAQAQNALFELVISDVAMPGLDGIGLLKKVRGHQHFKDTKMILLTGHGEKDLVQEALKWRVTSYLVKPFLPKMLEDKVREALASRGAKAA